MKKQSLNYKMLAFVLVVVLTFQSLHSINSHTYTTGFDNLHDERFGAYICVFASGHLSHFSYNCGKAFHL